MYDKVTHVFSNAHLLQSFTITAASPQSQAANLAALTGNLVGSPGAPAAQTGTDGASQMVRRMDEWNSGRGEKGKEWKDGRMEGGNGGIGVPLDRSLEHAPVRLLCI